MSGTRFWNGAPQALTIDITVKAYEDVKTKAGVFKAYRLEHRGSGRQGGGNSFTWTNSFWYAADVKSVVKATGSSPTFREWELLSYSLK